MILVNLGFRWFEWFLVFGFWCLISLLLARLEELLILDFGVYCGFGVDLPPGVVVTIV